MPTKTAALLLLLAGLWLSPATVHGQGSFMYSSEAEKQRDLQAIRQNIRNQEASMRNGNYKAIEGGRLHEAALRNSKMGEKAVLETPVRGGSPHSQYSPASPLNDSALQAQALLDNAARIAERIADEKQASANYYGGERNRISEQTGALHDQLDAKLKQLDAVQAQLAKGDNSAAHEAAMQKIKQEIAGLRSSIDEGLQGLANQLPPLPNAPPQLDNSYLPPADNLDADLNPGKFTPGSATVNYPSSINTVVDNQQIGIPRDPAPSHYDGLSPSVDEFTTKAKDAFNELYGGHSLKDWSDSFDTYKEKGITGTITTDLGGWAKNKITEIVDEKFTLQFPEMKTGLGHVSAVAKAVRGNLIGGIKSGAQNLTDHAKKHIFDPINLVIQPDPASSR